MPSKTTRAAPSNQTQKTSGEKDANQLQTNRLIVPGQRIGFAVLGQMRVQFVAALRAAIADAAIADAALTNVNFKVDKITTIHHSYGIEEVMACYKARYGFEQKFQALQQNNKVVQISTTDDRFSVAGGYNTLTDMPLLRARFTDVKTGVQSTNYYFSKVPGAVATITHDQVKQGFALAEFDYKQPGIRSGYPFAAFFTVHPKNRPYKESALHCYLARQAWDDHATPTPYFLPLRT